MRRSSLIMGMVKVGLLALIISSPLPAEEVVASAWATTPIQIDGQIEDWTGAALATEKGIGIDYAFRNDGRGLYVLVIFKNPKSLSSIDLTGLTLYASTTGKKDKDFGVRFIKKTVTGAQLIEYMEKMGQPLAEERKAEIQDKPQLILFTATAVNKKGDEVFPSGPVQNIDLPGFRLGRQEDAVLYEFRVPLVSRDVHPTGIGAEPGKDVKIGFEWGGMTKEMREAMRGQARGTRTGADANQDMEETTTGTYLGSTPSGPSGPKKHSFWVDVKLAQGQ